MRQHAPAALMPSGDAFAIFRQRAIENVNAGAFGAQAITAILATGDGHPSDVRAIFGDVPLEAIDEGEDRAAGISLGAAHGKPLSHCPRPACGHQGADRRAPRRKMGGFSLQKPQAFLRSLAAFFFFPLSRPPAVRFFLYVRQLNQIGKGHSNAPTHRNALLRERSPCQPGRPRGMSGSKTRCTTAGPAIIAGNPHQGWDCELNFRSSLAG